MTTYVVCLHPQQWQASCKSSVDACGFGDACCARHVFQEAAQFLNLQNIFLDEGS